MKYDPFSSIRHKDGFSSSTYLYDHILTSSISGTVCKWNLENGNSIAEFDTKPGIKFCVPYSIDHLSYDKLILQEQEAVSLFDLNKNFVYDVAKITPGCFARVSLLLEASNNNPLVIAPFGLNSVRIFDLRFHGGSICSNQVIEILPFKINHPQKSEVGMLHCCTRFYSLGEFCIVSTYESGSIAFHDIRKPNSPIIPVYIMDSLEPIPSLCVWNNVLLVGDTVGNIWMFYVSGDKGIIFLKKSNVSKGSIKPPGISHLDISPDGSILASGCWDRCVRILETKTLDLKCILDSHSSSISDVSFSKDSNKFCSSSTDGNVFVWDLFSN